jgi:predicted ATP-grasp superfamily ATP-dependent carboligase
VLPGSEETLVALSERRKELPPGLAAGLPPPEIVRRATDKTALAKLAAAAGLEMPPTVEIGRAELNGAPVRFPAVVKPVRTKTFTDQGFRHGRVRRVDDAAALVRAVEALPGDRWLVQPFLRGKLASVSGIAWEGRVLCAVHQVALRIAPAHCGGSSYAMTVARDGDLEAAVERLLAAIGWSGLFQVQFIRTDSGKDYLIDFNPRVYGSLALAVAAGANLPAIWVDLVLGRDPHLPDYRVGVRFRAEEKDVRALARELASGRPAEALRGAVPRRDTAHAVFELRDPLPLLSSAAKLRGLRPR